MIRSPWIAGKQFMASEEQRLSIGKVDRLSRLVLDWIVLRCLSNKPLHIQEIVMKSGIASPATIHKSLDTLLRAKLIELTIDAADLRRRQVTPSALAIDEIRMLDRAFRLWSKKNLD
jgi:DNA-binding MarR family transcriptional regulator